MLDKVTCITPPLLHVCSALRRIIAKSDIAYMLPAYPTELGSLRLDIADIHVLPRRSTTVRLCAWCWWDRRCVACSNQDHLDCDHSIPQCVANDLPACHPHSPWDVT